MSKRRPADGDRITRAAAYAGLLAVIIIAKAGSRILGYSFGWSLIVLAVLALIGAGVHFLPNQRKRPAAAQADDLTVPAPVIHVNPQEPPTQPVHYVTPAPPTAYSQ
ncbi:hypothetical protein OHB26_09435 [Nocardia sp. NBC_01503]|uniref:hypothetical protein n=1 Tax=Nocardia sp. NBC_01503 TaxID=2975997 RepID=UPI002E7AEAE2|nr:hypothetical protein [Nocardia sp. NBC_01503]WTL34398.1 hypothetical protein OHB26_09435 [Nocardia sp. NBC_01503]